MKTIFKYIAGAVAVAALAGCNLNPLPTFDQADSFVAFDRGSVTVDENAGTVTLPLTIASVDPVKTNISYELVDGTAKQGVNYDSLDESAVVVFDGTERTGSIVISIKDLAGTYTGDLSFSVKLVAATGINLGASNVCTVTINDLDHPLSAILGEYTSTAHDYFDDADVSWTVTLMKDPKDVNIVWVDGFSKTFAGTYPAADWRFYGNVVKDEDGTITGINFPCGQTFADLVNTNEGAKEAKLWAFEGGSSVTTSGNISFEVTSNGFASENGFGIGYAKGADGVSLFDMYNPGIVWVKK